MSHPLELTGLFILAVLYLIAPLTFIDYAGPPVFLIIMLAGAAHMLQRTAQAIWTCLFWFRVSSGVFFGLGNVSPEFANLTTRTYIDAFFLASPEHLNTFNILVTVSTLCILGTASLLAIYSPGIYRPQQQKDSLLLPMSLTCMAIGFPVKFITTVTIGTQSFAAVVAGSLLTLSLLAPLSIYLFTLYTLREKPALLPLAAALTLADMTLGLLLANKNEMILSLMMFIMAYLGEKTTRPRIILSAGAMICAFYFAVPIVSYIRNETEIRYHDISGSSLSDRIQFLSNYLGRPEDVRMQEEVQASLSRLSYMNAAALAISEYDLGRPGTGVTDAWVAFIPRYFWPEKPVTTDIGRDFNFIATRSSSSSSAPGIFADAYWNFGWLGIPIVMIPVGIWFFILSRFSLVCFSSNRWLQFPAVLLAMKMGFRTDGFIATDIIGTSVIIVSLMAVSLILETAYSYWIRDLVQKTRRG